jgi:hypothetical protein
MLPPSGAAQDFAGAADWQNVRYLLAIGVFAWLGLAGAGMWTVWAYSIAPGTAAAAPVRWPASDRPIADRLELAADRPTIVLLAHRSAHAMAADRDKGLAAGADDFDTKPVRFDQLLAKIAAAIEKRAAVRTETAPVG